MERECMTSDATGNRLIKMGSSAIRTYSGQNDHMVADLAAMMIEFPFEELKNAISATLGVVKPFEFFPVLRIERLPTDGGDDFWVHGYVTGWEKINPDDNDVDSKLMGQIRELDEFKD